MSYVDTQRALAAAWKASTPTIPDEARVPAAYLGKDGVVGGASYDFCLPRDHAAFTLLPEVCELVLDLFTELGIPWHAGVDGGPGNHLLSSQVQCVNALGQMVEQPTRIVAAFGDVLDIEEVLEIEPGRYLTFEYIGPRDFFDESPGVPRTRGARCTSVDAALKFRSSSGEVELALIEWKYTESYRRRSPDGKDRVRVARYERHLGDTAGPVRGDVLPVELLLDEPFYQLVRQQLLAHELEKIGAEGASRVRVLHVLSPDNHAYQSSLHRPQHRQLGSSVDEVWQRLLRTPDRFLKIDPRLFLDPEITSREYCLRYADDVLHDEAAMLEAFGISRAADLDDVVDNEGFEGYVMTDEHQVVLVADRLGTALAYPFRASELIGLARELAEKQE